MRTTYNIEQEWLKTQSQFSKLKEETHLEKLFYPSMKEINLPIESSFSWQEMNSSEILLRDGLAPLLWFLLRGTNSRRTFYINSSFSPFIPDVLRKNIRYFTLRTKNNKQAHLGKMVTGHYVTHWSSLLLWKKRLPSNLKKSLFSLTFERNNQGVNSLDPDWWKFYDRHLARIIKLPLKHEFGMNTHEEQFRGYTMVNLEDYLTVGLSYKDWKFALCGGTLSFSVEDKHIMKSFALSENTDLVLHNSPKKCILSKSDLKTLMQFSGSEEGDLPTYFYHYVRYLGEKYEKSFN